ncbi:hypothetical protein EV363DRAFT_1293883 [Boletus edulis]|nr:hypothetical protein EV363DRAFT_1293883 [Boletus edulis]
MPTNIIGPTLGAAQLAATLSGVPFAAGGVMVLQLIHAACSQVSVHKQSSLLVGTDATATFDEAEASSETMLVSWRAYTVACKNGLIAVKSKYCVRDYNQLAQIARDLDKCYADVDNAMERLHPALEETLQQLLISPREIERAVQQHISGGNAAYELMRLGQEGFAKRHPFRLPHTLVMVGRSSNLLLASRPPSPITTVQNQIEQALLDLHRLTNIPPTIPILNNQVALKTLRIVDEHDPKAKRLQLVSVPPNVRFEHEISVWSKLKHENVLTMLGVVTNMGSIHIVSPWQLDNVRNYRRENPDVNPLNLLIQAAKGLEYLHSQQIVHGHRESPDDLPVSDH